MKAGVIRGGERKGDHITRVELPEKIHKGEGVLLQSFTSLKGGKKKNPKIRVLLN